MVGPGDFKENEIWKKMEREAAFANEIVAEASRSVGKYRELKTKFEREGKLEYEEAAILAAIETSVVIFYKIQNFENYEVQDLKSLWSNKFFNIRILELIGKIEIAESGKTLLLGSRTTVDEALALSTKIEITDVGKFEGFLEDIKGLIFDKTIHPSSFPHENIGDFCAINFRKKSFLGIDSGTDIHPGSRPTRELQAPIRSFVKMFKPVADSLGIKVHFQMIDLESFLKRSKRLKFDEIVSIATCPEMFGLWNGINCHNEGDLRVFSKMIGQNYEYNAVPILQKLIQLLKQNGILAITVGTGNLRPGLSQPEFNARNTFVRFLADGLFAPGALMDIRSYHEENFAMSHLAKIMGEDVASRVLVGSFFARVDLSTGQPKGQRAVSATEDEKKVGRNDPCTCGSGKKFKKCCWK